MRLPLMTTRRWLVAVAAIAIALGSVVVMNEIDQRARRYHKAAAYHGDSESRFGSKAAYWEALARDPEKGPDLPLALFKAGRWSRRQALDMEVESLIGRIPPRARWEQMASEARAYASERPGAYWKRAEYHMRERQRYERATFNIWPPAEPDPPEPPR